MSRGLKDNVLIRGLYFRFRQLMGWFPNRRKLGYCADNVIISPPLYINGYHNVIFGDGCAIGPGAGISAPNAKFICKPHCVIASGLTVHTGNHARIIGKYCLDITEETKPAGFDKDVVVGEDVWIASNVTLLAGVTIGRNANVAAGAVVTKSMPPYCVCGGVPAKVIKFYWTIDEILEHEAQLYPEEERYTREELEEIIKKYTHNN